MAIDYYKNRIPNIPFKNPFGVTCTLEEIGKFETEYNLVLPEFYKKYLLEVGNGGLGPFYGLYSLQDIVVNYQWLTSINDEESLYNETFSKKVWDDLISKYDSGQINAVQLYKRVASGVLVIGTQGCDIDTGIIVSGPYKGEVIYINWNFESVNMPFLTRRRFEDWICGYFNELLLNHDVKHYGYTYQLDETQLVNMYKTEDSGYEKRRILLSLFELEKMVPQTIEIIKSIKESDLLPIKTKILYKFAPSDANEVVEEMIKLNSLTPQIVAELPDTVINKNYRAILNLLINTYTDYECGMLTVSLLKCDKVNEVDLLNLFDTLDENYSAMSAIIVILSKIETGSETIKRLKIALTNGSEKVFIASINALKEKNYYDEETKRIVQMLIANNPYNTLIKNNVNKYLRSERVITEEKSKKSWWKWF